MLDRRVPLVVPALLPCKMQSAVNVADLEPPARQATPLPGPGELYRGYSFPSRSEYPPKCDRAAFTSTPKQDQTDSAIPTSIRNWGIKH